MTNTYPYLVSDPYRKWIDRHGLISLLEYFSVLAALSTEMAFLGKSISESLSTDETETEMAFLGKSISESLSTDETENVPVADPWDPAGVVATAVRGSNIDEPSKLGYFALCRISQRIDTGQTIPTDRDTIVIGDMPHEFDLRRAHKALLRLQQRFPYPSRAQREKVQDFAKAYLSLTYLALVATPIATNLITTPKAMENLTVGPAADAVEGRSNFMLAFSRPLVVDEAAPGDGDLASHPNPVDCSPLAIIAASEAYFGPETDRFANSILAALNLYRAVPHNGLPDQGEAMTWLKNAKRGSIDATDTEFLCPEVESALKNHAKYHHGFLKPPRTNVPNKSTAAGLVNLLRTSSSEFGSPQFGLG